VYLGAIAHNVRGIRRKLGPGVKVMAVVKAQAYGHGLEAVARFLEPSLADAFGVAFPEEGAALRASGIRKPILVFTLPAPSQADLYVHHHLEATVCTLREARFLNSAAERSRTTIGVHLKLETGMNRIGVRPALLGSLLRGMAGLRRLEIRGVFTHFAESDARDKSFTRRQLREFEDGLEILRQCGVQAQELHCANSAAILDIPESAYTMVRPGIMMYGYYPSHTTSESIPLKPALSLRTRVALVKTVERGETVSYGRIYRARRRTKIVTLPLGYADGFFRGLTNKASVLLHGKAYPVVGRVCMDQIMADVGTADIRPGDEAVVIGRQRSSVISAWDLARPLGTIPYEICCALSQRVPRHYHMP
jgi:alanine racemase